MTKNPLINALAATLYITLVALVMYFGTKVKVGADSLLAPIAIISLFTLSAAVMGYLFLWQPLQMYFDNQRKEALRLFLQTMLCFGVITAVLLTLLFFRVL